MEKIPYASDSFVLLTYVHCVVVSNISPSQGQG